ncbi:MAG: AarF/UbiB family protein [Bryobacteraceae bacterium]|jgi:ubiquinone biosynthesis protein
MSSRHSLVEYFKRLFQILHIGLRQLTILARRRLSGRPVLGHELLREGLEQVGGSFLKLGQIMSLQLQTLPKEYCDALLMLLDNVPTCSSEAVAGVFVAEFGCRPESLYSTFDYLAIASASIGQVHKATLRDGTSVAVKVRRPGVQRDFHRDILLMQSFVRVVFLLRIRSLYFMRDPVRELVTWTRDELDYRREATHCEMLRANAADSTTERIPKIFWDLTRSRVLTMEFLEGHSVSAYFRMLENDDQDALAAIIDSGFDPSIFCGNVVKNFLRDAFRFGVFHADLHPANLLILPNNVVGYVDFGIVAKLTTEARYKQIELTMAYAGGDPEAIYRQFLNICIVTADADLKGMRKRIAEMAQTWYEEPSVHGKVQFRVSITVAMMDLLTVCRNYGVLVDREMIKYIRSTVLVDGVISRMAPGLDMALALRDVTEEYLYEQSRKKIFSAGGALSLLTDLAIWIKTGPASMVRALELIERRQMTAKTGSLPVEDQQQPLRARAFAGIAVWALVMVFMTLGGSSVAKGNSPFWEIILGTFVTSWTIWLLWLLRRLVPRKERPGL